MFQKDSRFPWPLTIFLLAVLVTILTAGFTWAVPVTFVHHNSGASTVFLAGDFNGWSDAANKMQNDGGIWTLIMELDPGSYQYKFVVDGTWSQDDANPETNDDGFGGKNSVVNVTGDEAMYAAGSGQGVAAATAVASIPAVTTASGEVAVSFQVSAPGASSVFLAGDFNGWSDSTDKMLEKDGLWSLSLNLASGQYMYKFVIDGTWTQDEANPQSGDDGFGGKNSLVDVKAGVAKMDAAAGGTGEVVAPAAEATGDTALRSVEFTYTPVISGVGGIYLAGSFNDWNDSKTKMTDPDNDGTYTVTLLLAPGSYQYKFVVDGNWQVDPNNPEGQEDGFGGQNSVLNVDTSFATIEIELGDGIIYSDDLEAVFDYSTCNPLTETLIAITARAHKGDVQELVLEYSVSGGQWQEKTMLAVEQDPAFQYYRVNIDINKPDDKLEYQIRYSDADNSEYFGVQGMATKESVVPFVWTAAEYPPFFTPEWAKDGIIYQIFPERFANGDKSNDPDFSEEWYQGANKLPASGKTNSEYFHMVDDWYDIKGLVKSPYRTDGKPDYFSFYGGDIKGIKEKLDYLNDLGITVIYFNPLNQGMSNHKYDPVDYLKIDPHFGTTEEFKVFIKACHDHGIRVVVDMAFNHTGNWHFAFRDAVENGPSSEYYKWYEFHRWPLPQNRDFNASDYYDCWWGFGLHPNLNFDLKLANSAENNIDDISRSTANMPVVDYVLSVADFWLGELDIDGFRLDVPNEVPFWFWKLFNERCKSIKEDCWLVGELWGNAGRWIGPHCFDSTMNYKFFRDPVMDFFGKGNLSASDFDQRLGPGRFQYPPQSVAVMMNLSDSHDTIRFLTSARDERRLMLAAMFGMTYVGMPHIWYGDEIGMTGGKDPDCRRPMDWRYEGDPRRQALRDYYGTITRMRRDTPVLSRGSFTALNTTGKGYAFARSLDGKLALALFNAGVTPVTLTISGKRLKELAGPEGSLNLEVMVGPDSFRGADGGILQVGKSIGFGSGDVEISLPGLTGAVLIN